MVEIELADFRLFRPLSGGFAGPPSKNKDIQSGVTDQPVAAVDSTLHFPGSKKPGNIGSSIGINQNAAVLIMQGWINQDRLDTHIDSESGKLSVHRRDLFQDSTLP